MIRINARASRRQRDDTRRAIDWRSRTNSTITAKRSARLSASRDRRARARRRCLRGNAGALMRSSPGSMAGNRRRPPASSTRPGGAGRGTAGPADHVDEGPGSTRCAKACRAALTARSRRRDCRRYAARSVVIGLSGYDDNFDGAVRPCPAHSASTRPADRAGGRDRRAAGGPPARRYGFGRLR